MKKSIFILILVFSLEVICSSLYAETLEELYNTGNIHFRKGEYEQAIDKYFEVLNLNIENPHIYYNLGNSYFRTGNLGRTIQYYEKALKLAPRDNDIRLNLELAELLTEDEIITPPKSIIERALLKYYNFFCARELIFVTSILFGAGFIFLFFMVISTGKNGKYISLAAAVFMFLLTSVMFLTTALKTSDLLTKDYAIILSDELEVMSGPKDSFTTVFTLHEGTKVMIRETRNKWFFISLPNGMNGWIPDSLDNEDTLGII